MGQTQVRDMTNSSCESEGGGVRGQVVPRPSVARVAAGGGERGTTTRQIVWLTHSPTIIIHEQLG